MADKAAFLRKYEEELKHSFGGTEVMSKAADPMNLAALTSQAKRRELADRFIDLLVDESTLLKAVRVHRTNAPAGEITKLNISGHVTESASENTKSDETRRPVNTYLDFATKKTRSQMDITGEVMEDNIEGSGGQQVFLNMMLKAMANDMETLAIEGSEDVAGDTDYARLVRTNDGYHILTAPSEGVHTVDCGGKQPGWKLFSKMLKSLPTKYRRNLQDLRWIMSMNTWLSLVEEAQSRLTNLGDQAWTGNVPPILGIPVLLVPLMPENLTISGTAANGTFLWLTNPQNLVYVIQRDLKVEWERVPRYDRDEMTAFMRTDFLVQDTDAVVKAINVNLDEEAARYGAAAAA